MTTEPTGDPPTAPEPPATAPAAPAKPPAAPAPPDDDDGDDGDGEQGGTESERRLRAETMRWRKEAKAQRKRADEFEAKANAEAASAAERLERLEAAERRNQRATVERLAAAAGFHAGEPADLMDGLADALAADDGESTVAARLAEVAKARPYLVNGGASSGGTITPGRQTAAEDATGSGKDGWLRAGPS